jgi:tetratricopeptide (TPR) repeat protein
MNTKELERNIKKIIATGSGYGSEYKHVLKRTKDVLKQINKGRKTTANFFELGELCLKLEDSGLALNAFKKGYQLDPNNVNCGCYYALLLEQVGQISEALSVYLELNKVAPENIVLAERMLSIFYDKKDYRQVFIICQYFLASELNYAVTYEYISKIHFDYGLKNEAIKYLENALTIEPENSKYLQKLIVYYYHNENYNKVVTFKNYIDNTEMLPISMALLYANALAEIGRIDESRKYFTKTLLNSEGEEKYQVLSEIGLFHQHTEQNTKKAIFIFGYILKRDPFNIMALTNMAQYQNSDYCLRAYKAAYQQQPNNAVVALNYSYSLLDDGQLKEGFKLYENRLVVHARFLSHRVTTPEKLQDKNLFVWKEQGLGDEIRWSWFYKNLSKSCLKATIQVDERLLPLMNRSFPKLSFTGKDIKELINDEDFTVYDNEIMMASLGRYYIDDIVDAQNNAEQGKSEEPYLLADAKRVSYWKEKLLSLTSKKTAGICWRSGNQAKLRYVHYMSVEQIINIFTDVDCCVVNVQYDYTQDELDLLSSALGERFIHFPEIDLKNDIDDLAALLKALDLVFTAVTAVSALAGAIGSNTLTFIHMGEDDSISIYGKPYDVFYSRIKYLGKKSKKHNELLEYYKSNIKKTLVL